MNIDWVIPCRFVEVHDNLGTLVGAGIDTFWVSELPSPIQVAMAVRLLGLQEELQPDVGHEVTSIVRAPDGTTLSSFTENFTVAPAGEPTERSDWLQGVMVTTIVKFVADLPGTFTFEHIVDGSSASVPIHVVHGVRGAG